MTVKLLKFLDASFLFISALVSSEARSHQLREEHRAPDFSRQSTAPGFVSFHQSFRTGHF